MTFAPDGAAASCKLAHSSGSAPVDRLACTQAMATMRFNSPRRPQGWMPFDSQMVRVSLLAGTPAK